MKIYEVFLDGEKSILVKADFVFENGSLLEFRIETPVMGQIIVKKVALFNLENILGYAFLKEEE